MKQSKSEVEMQVLEMDEEELQSTYGGAWWEIRIEKEKVVFIFHFYDDDKPK